MFATFYWSLQKNHLQLVLRAAQIPSHIILPTWNFRLIGFEL